MEERLDNRSREPLIPRRVERSRREDLLEVAIRTFAANGYEGTSTAAITREIGVTQPLIHHHFGSKEALWKAAMDHLFAEVRARFGHIDEEFVGKPAVEQQRILVRRFVRQCAERPQVAQIVLREATGNSPRFAWLVTNHIAPLMATVTRLVSRLQKEASLPRGSAIHHLFIVMGGAHLIFTAPALFESLAGTPPNTEASIEAHAQALIALLESWHPVPTDRA